MSIYLDFSLYMANKYKKDVPDLFSQPPLSRDLFDEGKTKDENIPQQSENITIPDPLKNI